MDHPFVATLYHHPRIFALLVKYLNVGRGCLSLQPMLLARLLEAWTTTVTQFRTYDNS